MGRREDRGTAGSDKSHRGSHRTCPEGELVRYIRDGSEQADFGAIASFAPVNLKLIGQQP